MLNNPNPDFLAVVERGDFLPPISNWTTLGGIFLIGTVGVATGLASVVKYNDTVKAPAVVRPAGEIRLVQSHAEGTVKNILVKENQAVKRGEVIAYTDGAQLEIKKSQILGNIQLYRQQLEQVDAQISALDNQTIAEVERNKRSVASATAELSQQVRDLQQKEDTSNAEVEEAAASVRLAEDELHKAQTELQSSQTNLKSLQAVLQVATSRWNRYQENPEIRNALSRNLLEEAQLAVEQHKQALEKQLSDIEGHKQTIERQQKAVEVAKARYKRALAAVNPGSAVVIMAKEKIAQEQASSKANTAKLLQDRENLLYKRVEAQNQFKNAQKELKQLEKEIQKNLITSPEAGTILKLELRNSGQFLRPGDVVAQIAPNNNTSLIVKARVAVSNRSKVKVCEAKNVADCKQGKVQMQISTYSYTDYGILNGAVRSISADAISPQNQSNALVTPYYEVTIEPEKLFLTKGNKSYPVQAGMEVEADIIATEETVLTFIMRKARLLVNV
ncbi:Secretion protein HlyD [Rivularia sp. IAM M-261]|nr:Secretion protein HlyD [Rivularia sp. IAM M-261]